MSSRCPNRVGAWGPPCRLEMAHLGSCLPERFPRAARPMAAVLLVVALAGCSNGQTPSNDCGDAATWHREQALYASDAETEGWHQHKAEVYEDAAWRSEAGCHDWMAHRDPPSDIGGAA